MSDQNCVAQQLYTSDRGKNSLTNVGWMQWRICLSQNTARGVATGAIAAGSIFGGGIAGGLTAAAIAGGVAQAVNVFVGEELPAFCYTVGVRSVPMGRFGMPTLLPAFGNFKKQ